MRETKSLGRPDSSKPMTVLLVDDEVVFRRNLAMLLTRRGFTVDQAASGMACMDIINSKPIDVVVMDVKMPGMSGIETLKKIRPMRKNVEIILMTGQASTRDGVEGIKAGAFDYLIKPVDLDHLVEKIRQARDRLRLKEENRKAVELRSQMERQMIVTDRLASLGTLASGVAHEINNPLAIIKQSAKFMRLLLERADRSGPPDASGFDKALSNIENAVERAKRITHQLLGFVGKNDSVIVNVDMGQLIDDVLGILQGAVKAKGLKIVREIAPGLGPVQTDPDKLGQVLTNLIINAVHATPRGGRIALIVEASEKEIILSVQDDGQGVPKENLEKIFEPFFTTKKTGQGTGLGLYVTRGIVDMLGGTIRVDRRTGPGTRFTVILPKQRTPDNHLL